METERSNDEIQEHVAEDLVEFDICKESELVVEEIKDPEVGMKFNSIDDCMEYYIKYGNQKGFPVKKRSSEKNYDGEVKSFTLACTRSGVASSKSKEVLNLRHVRKTGCKVNVRAALCPDGKWRLSTIILDHNHDLSPEKSRFYKKNRIMRCYVKRRLELNDRAGIRQNKTVLFNSVYECIDAGFIFHKTTAGFLICNYVISNEAEKIMHNNNEE